MRVAAHYRALGWEVELQRPATPAAVERGLFDVPERVYASLIFDRTRPVAERLLQVRPDAVVGGTGWDTKLTLEHVGISTLEQDYSIYPDFTASIGFTQRGCRLKCPFCKVPEKEGAVRPERTVAQLWRGEPYPKHLLLLDNDFFGQEGWRDLIEEMRAGDFAVSFNQGINARMLNDETAAAIASVRYYDDDFKARRIYTAWDNRKDERRLFDGLNALVRHGVKPDHIMVYMLIGYWPGETLEGWEYRRARLREFGARPYPMPFERTPEAVGFQRWVVGAYDRRIPWSAWKLAKYEPRSLGAPQAPTLFNELQD
jgi:hypothetical protein